MSLRERLISEGIGVSRIQYFFCAPCGEFRVQNPAGYVIMLAHARVLDVVRNEQQMPFELQPGLKGALLELRPLRAADFDDLFAVAADPLIWEQHPARDRHEEKQFRIFFREAMESGGALIASDTRDGRIIGSSRFHGYDSAKSEIEIGWTFLARPYWGGRYNGEMKRLMLDHAFRFVDRVIFLIGPQNLRSRRAVEKIGGVLVGSKLGAAGREIVVYEITPAAYERTPRMGA